MDTAAQLQNNSISPIGVSQPHDNKAPSLAVSVIITQQGLYPTPN